MPVEWLNDGGAVVTLDPPVWTPLDVFTWVAFRERRIGADHLFTFAEWSLDWGHWPPQSLDRAFYEIASGVPWQPIPDSWEAGWADKDRAWARNIMECTGASALELGWVLDADILRFRHNEARYHVAKAEVMGAIRDGRLPVWARKAYGSARPNHDATPELLDHRLFTHDETREVNEGAWVDGADNYKGPWWDQVRFDADKVRAIWTARPGAGIASFSHSFPAAGHIPPWDCVCWRAFGALDVPPHIAHHRSFDGGGERFPDEGEARYAARQAEHRRFDAAEREVMDLLASGRISAKGQPPAEGAPHKARPGRHVDVPAGDFLDRQLAFDLGGGLIVRRDTLGRLFPPLDERGTEASPEHPLWHDLLIEAAAVREAWGIAEAVSLLPAPEQPSLPTADPLASRKRKHTGRDWRTGDAPLVQEMRRMIDAKEATSATDAARAVVGRAKGDGQPGSKVARLVTRYGEAYPAV